MNDVFTTMQPWFPSIGAFIFFTVIRYLYKNFLVNLLRKLYSSISLRHGEEALDAFEKPINVMLFVIGFYAAINLAPVEAIRNWLFADRILRSTIVFSFFWGLYNMSDTTHGIMWDVLERAGIRSEESLSNIFSTVLRLIIVILGFVTIAKEWNYDISGFIASLSIGSVAIAFAAKDALANVFGSLIIILDKPFQVGDWVTANGVEGIVEKISFRSTCIRTFPQELVYIPNSLLSNTPITNFTMRQKRRLDFTLGLTYSTSHAKMAEFVSKLKAYLEGNPHIYEEDVRVHFINYGSSSLDVRVTCYARTGNHVEFLNITQEVNLYIMELADQVGVSCAFPSTSVYFENPIPKE